MYNSSKLSDSRPLKSSLHINDSPNGTVSGFIQPKITSTPVLRRDAMFATPPKPSLLSPRKYSLSEIATPPRAIRKDLTRFHSTGPLLASTKYNISVSTYEDTKSPGFAGRIVQYNEQAERDKVRQRLPTHQTKYASPGLFPVVHLFKKKPPTLDQKPKRLSIRIASPEYTRQHTPEYNRKLLEGIIKCNSPLINGRTALNTSMERKTSTRSVLDALKEISRKRIHANEGYDLDQDSGKRIRTEEANGTEASKRGRESPPLETSPSPTRPVSKRICMYDEYTASCSSMDFSTKKTGHSGSKRKSISISTSTENQKETKQVKLVNAETQTIIRELEINSKSKEIVDAEDVPDKDKVPEIRKDESFRKRESPVKIFDDAPLERIRKNRLAALMGSLTGKEPVLTPKPDYVTTLGITTDIPNANDEGSKMTEDILNPDENISETVGCGLKPVGDISKPFENPLISILVSPNKVSPVKSTKHVHFSVPESTSQTVVTGFSLTQSTPSITSPISSTSEAKISFGSGKAQAKETPAPPSSPVGPGDGNASSSGPVLFGMGNSSSSQTSVISGESSTTLPITEASKDGSSQFNSPSTSVDITLHTAVSSTANQIPFGSAVSTSSPPKVSGFKFDLAKPITNNSTSFNLNPQTGNNKLKSPFVITSLPASSVPSATSVLASGGFSFGKNVSSTSVTTTTNSKAVTTPSSSSTPIFSFGSVKPSATSFTFATTTTSTSSSLPVFALTTNPSTPAFASNVPITSHSTSNAPIFSFGTASNSSTFGTPTTTVAFGVSSATSTGGVFSVPKTSLEVIAMPGFGVNAPPSFGVGATPSFSVTTPSSFGHTTTPSFGVTTSATFGVTASPTFGAATTTTMSSFGTPIASISFGTSAANPVFGGNKTSPFTTSASVAPAFGASTSSPFGKSSMQFGQNTTQSPFGATTTTVPSFASTNVFGGTTSTLTSVFGGANVSTSAFAPKTGFGVPSNTTNMFGDVSSTQASGFSTANNKSTSNSFGNVAAVATFNFGAKTTANHSFGVVNAFGTTTTASSNFGTPTTSAFGASNTFGNNSTNFGSGNVFGGSSASAFGTPVTTQTGPFGTTSTSTFGTANSSFGSGSSTSVFGNSAPAFSANTAPFSGGFGATNSPGFGPNAFTKPESAQTNFTSNAFGSGGFGQQQPAGFGGNSTSTSNAVFNFGSGASKPAGVFSFGAAPAAEPPKPTFNFTAGNNSTMAAFGNGATPSFGNAGAAAFGATQFNASQPSVPGTFSIGSGPAPARPRVHLKAKRRT